MVARKMEMIGRDPMTLLIMEAMPDMRTATARGMVTSRYGQMCRKAFQTKMANSCR
jgi:hypothetical protein